MKILREELLPFEDSLGNGFQKIYVPNSNLISLYSIGFFTYRYEYDDKLRLKLEIIIEHLGREDVWEILYKKEYIYFDGGFRVLYYRTGYKSFRDVNRYELLIDEMVKLPDYINDENVLLSVDEVNISNSGLVTSLKKVNLISNEILEYKYFYDDSERLISKFDSKENQNTEYVFEDNFLKYSAKGNYKILHSYNAVGIEIERQFINNNIKDSNSLKINFNYNGNHLEEIIINFPSFGFLYDLECTAAEIDYRIPKLNFNGFPENKEENDDSFSLIEQDYKKIAEILKLPSFHYLNNIEEFWRIGFSKIVAKYSINNDIESISFLDTSNKTLDKIFFNYFNNFDSEVSNKFKITQSFVIRDGEIVKLFEHKYFY